MKIKIFLILALLASFTLPKFAPAQDGQFDKYGGWTGLKGEKSGFFHTEQVNGRWWIITPEGNAFWSIGMYCVRFSGIPETDTKKRPYKDACLAKYGSEGEWAKITKIRLKDWGFNTIGDWSSESTYKDGLDRKHAPLAYVIGIDLPRKADNVIAKGAYGYFPDVFSDKFKESVKSAMKYRFEHQPYFIKDPWLLGYFLADEPSWYGSKQRRGALVNDFIALESDSPGKIAWVNFVKSIYSEINTLNNSWGTDFKSFTDLFTAKKIPINENSEKDNLLFFKIIAEEFSKILHDTLRGFDKNHMILGTRPSRLYPELVEASAKYSDIFSTSSYGLNEGYKVNPKFKETIDRMYENAGRPIMLGVIITAEDAGLPYGIVRSQKDRGISYWRYMAEVAAHPAIVGMHWFQYFDPPKKCYDEKAANWGLVNQKDEPYEEAVKLIAQANKTAYTYGLRLSTVKPEFDSFLSFKKEEPQEIAKGELKQIIIPIENSGFESGKEAWKLQTWKGKSKVSIDSRTRHSGKNALKIEGGKEEGWDSIGVALQQPDFLLLPGYEYKLSAWIKTDNVESEAFVRIKATYKKGEVTYFKALPVYGTKDWTLVEANFSPKSENSIDYLVCQLNGGGSAWFDDIKLEVIKQ
ncbi:MAG: carbohydrate binding domain-containing protein [Candidatus Omnitrophota bacterium]